jgi:hypothetical protein
MSRKNPLVRQALQKPVGGSMPDRPCDRAAKNRPFMGISVKPARSCRAWVTYAGLSDPGRMPNALTTIKIPL